jgi:pyruvate kinase
LIEAGMDVARLNFSHGEPAEHQAALELVRKTSAALGRHVAVLQDLQGPKIRTGSVQHPPLHLAPGESFTITTLPFAGTGQSVATSYASLPTDVKPGDRIVLADGTVELKVRDTTPTAVNCVVIRGGDIGSHTGINLPGVRISAPSLTDKDVADLKFGLSIGVDFVALSFVRRPEDIVRAKELIAKAGASVPVVAKLEKREAIDRLEEIVAAADAVMVARGDLGVEFSPERVPVLQKEVISNANRQARPVITATQMLESMVHGTRPTRAEASDVANAIFDGTDAVMLSAETAIGDNPIGAVQQMARIAAEAEAHAEEFGRHRPPVFKPLVFAEVIAEATATAVRRLAAAAVVARTESGFTARAMSNFRPPSPIVAVTPSEQTARRTALLWGVTPVVVPDLGNLEDLVRRIDLGLLPTDLAGPGEDVVLTASSSDVRHTGETNVLRLHRITAG